MANNNSTTNKSPSGGIVDLLTNLVGKDLAGTIRTEVIPEAIRVVLHMIPEPVFDKVFGDKQLFWRIVSPTVGLIIKKLTNMTDIGDEVITEVMKELTQQIEVVKLQHKGIKESKVAVGSPKTLDVKNVAKILKAIMKAGSHGKEVDMVMNLYCSMLGNTNEADKSVVIEALSKLTAKEIVEFVFLLEENKESFLEHFLGAKKSEPKVIVKKKKHVKMLTKIDNMFGDDRLVGSIINKIFPKQN